MKIEIECPQFTQNDLVVLAQHLRQAYPAAYDLNVVAHMGEASLQELSKLPGEVFGDDLHQVRIMARDEYNRRNS